MLDEVGKIERTAALLMDRAYADQKTRMLAWELHFKPVVPPKRNMRHPWEYDQELYKQRNEVDWMFRRLKGFRLIATRYDKTDVMFSAGISLALILIALNSMNRLLGALQDSP